MAAGADLIKYAAETANDVFQLSQSYIKNRNLFLFGSVDSFLETGEQDFAELNRLPFYSYINLGLESADQKTLDILKKPVSAHKVQEAFRLMQEINKKYESLEVTSNFLLMENPLPNHYHCFENMMASVLPSRYVKGAIYLSPLKGFSFTPERSAKNFRAS